MYPGLPDSGYLDTLTLMSSSVSGLHALRTMHILLGAFQGGGEVYGVVFYLFRAAALAAAGMTAQLDAAKAELSQLRDTKMLRADADAIK